MFTVVSLDDAGVAMISHHLDAIRPAYSQPATQDFPDACLECDGARGRDAPERGGKQTEGS
jgi:hypothetical protein